MEPYLLFFFDLPPLIYCIFVIVHLKVFYELNFFFDHTFVNRAKLHWINGFINHWYLEFQWVQADAEALPFEDESMDLYTIAFGIRNTTHIDKVCWFFYKLCSIVLSRHGKCPSSHRDISTLGSRINGGRPNKRKFRLWKIFWKKKSGGDAY